MLRTLHIDAWTFAQLTVGIGLEMRKRTIYSDVVDVYHWFSVVISYVKSRRNCVGCSHQFDLLTEHAKRTLFNSVIPILFRFSWVYACATTNNNNAVIQCMHRSNDNSFNWRKVVSANAICRCAFSFDAREKA